jgi:hypothetical protein
MLCQKVIKMPLPSVRLYGAKLCQCKSKRTKLPCKNAAAFGSKSCRMHGAHKSHARLSGNNHPNFIHGLETISAKIERTTVNTELNNAFKIIMYFYQKQSMPVE